MNDKELFLKRMFLYRLQHWIAFLLSPSIWFGTLSWVASKWHKTGNVWFQDTFMTIILCAPFIIFFIYNTITYFYSKYLVERYGIEMFSDLDQDWLIEHQAFDCKVFGECFARSIQCRKIAGPYMLMVMIPAILINIYVATGSGILYFGLYFLYRDVYLDTAVSYKVPRAFGGGGVVVSKIIDPDFNKIIDSNLNKKNDDKEVRD